MQRSCPLCDLPLPRRRAPANLRQAMWGGWTCAGCDTELDARGQPLDGQVTHADAVAFASPSPLRLQLLVALPLLALLVSGGAWLLLPAIPLAIVPIAPFLCWLAIFLAFHIVVPTDTLVVRQNAFRFRDQSHPYAHVVRIETHADRLVVTTDTRSVTIPRASQAAQAALQDALDRFRAAQDAGQDTTAAQVALTALVGHGPQRSLGEATSTMKGARKT